MLRIGSRVPGPRFDLGAFQAEVRNGNFHVYRTRALDIICEVRRCTPRQAREFARQSILSLVPDDYSHSLELLDGQPMDVYAKIIAAEGWYLKIEINMRDGQPGIVSCHPAEFDIQTRRGIVPGARKKSHEE